MQAINLGIFDVDLILRCLSLVSPFHRQCRGFRAGSRLAALPRESSDARQARR